MPALVSVPALWCTCLIPLDTLGKAILPPRSPSRHNAFIRVARTSRVAEKVDPNAQVSTLSILVAAVPRPPYPPLHRGSLTDLHSALYLWSQRWLRWCLG